MLRIHIITHTPREPAVRRMLTMSSCQCKPAFELIGR